MLTALKTTTTPKRIVCLVPSITQLLHYLHLEDETVGITKFCIHPTEWHITKTKIGGTKNININKIKSLLPDCIICSKEENIANQIELLSPTIPVFVTNVTNYTSSLKMIADIGHLTGKLALAKLLIKNIKLQFNFTAIKPIKAIYLIWQNPYLTVGGDTFIHSMMQKAGFVNMYEKNNRYPTLTLQDIQTLAPEVVLLSSEPYPFKIKHAMALQKLLPNSKVILVDGEFFSWYGSKMLAMPHYFIQLYQQITAV